MTEIDTKKIYETKFKKAYAERDFAQIAVLSMQYPEMKKYLSQKEAMDLLSVYETFIVASVANMGKPGKIIVELKADKDITQKINESLKNELIN